MLDFLVVGTTTKRGCSDDGEEAFQARCDYVVTLW